MSSSSLGQLEKAHENEMVSKVSKYLSNIGYKNFNPNNLWMLEEPILTKLQGNARRVYQQLS